MCDPRKRGEKTRVTMIKHLAGLCIIILIVAMQSLGKVLPRDNSVVAGVS